MSEEFRKDTEQVSSEENTGAAENAQQKPEGYTEQSEQHTEGRENASAVETVSGQTDASKGQPTSGTTYSWVNPKLTGEERKEDNSASYTGQAEQNFYRGAGEYGQSGQNAYQNDSQSGQTSAGGTQTGGQQRHMYQSYHIDTLHPEEPQAKKKKDRKVKKPMSVGKKWGMVIAMGAVFGLVAGGVFTGTSMLGAQLTGAGAGNNVAIPTTATTTTGTQSSDSSTASGMSVKDVASSAMPSLVAISTTTVEEVQTFFGTASQEVPASGTGVIVGQNDEELLIATNNHVDNGATQLSVSFTDDTTIEGQIKGTDEANDLAVVSVKLSDIPSDTQSQIKIATMGDSDALEVGDQVVAIGNALGSGQSVTSGYVSALDRDVTSTDETTGQETTSEGLIQTDAAINPGNSGGALLNMNGELIGINEAKSAATSTGSSVDNIGFAIPIDKAETSLKELMNLTTREKVDESQASYLGIQGQTVSSDVTQLYGIPSGVVVTSVVENGPAAQAGIQEGDIITSLDRRSVTSIEQLRDTLQYYASGETIGVTVQRSDNGKYVEQTLNVTLGSAQEAQQQ